MKRRFGPFGLSGVALLVMVFLSTVPAASAVTVTSVTPEEGCPGEIVTFRGSGFKTGIGQRPKAEWVDEGIKEQFGAQGSEKQSTAVLETRDSTAQHAVVPLFFQVWAGPRNVSINGKGTVKFEGKTFGFEYVNLYNCFGTGSINGATGPTGPTGPEGKPGGPTGPTGPTGFGCGACELRVLRSGESETGGWAASISASSGAQQMQDEGVVSLPIKLKEYEAGEGVKLKYRDAEEALKPEKPCLGSVEEPIAEKGFLCAYRGGAGNGSKENEDLNVTKKEPEVFFQTFFGTKITEIENVHGNIGVDIVFRTLQFNATGTGPPAALTANSYMAAQGSWAVTAR